MTREEVVEDAGWFEIEGERAWGQVNLQAGKTPRATIALDTDGPWSRPGGFPRESKMETLVGHLMSNETVVFGEAHLREMFPGQIEVAAAWALTGVGLPDDPSGQIWRGIRARCAGLDQVLASPFKKINLPRDYRAAPQRYTVETERVVLHSSGEAVDLTATHYVTVKWSAGRRFSVESTAEVVLESNAGMRVRDWLDQWVEPLSAILLLLTGGSERVGPVILSTERPQEAPRSETARLWGSDIHQDPPDPADPGRFREPLARLDNAPPLADMIATWRSGDLPASIGQLFRAGLDTDLPIFPRFSALIQGLEALDAHLHADAETADDLRYRERRQAARETVRQLPDDVLTAEHKRFIREKIPSHATVGLSSRLRRSIRLVADADLIEAWERQVIPLRDELGEALGPNPGLADVLAAARNRLAHGGHMDQHAAAAAIPVLDLILRGSLFGQLGFEVTRIREALKQANHR